MVLPECCTLGTQSAHTLCHGGQKSWLRAACCHTKAAPTDDGNQMVPSSSKPPPCPSQSLAVLPHRKNPIPSSVLVGLMGTKQHRRAGALCSSSACPVPKGLRQRSIQRSADLHNTRARTHEHSLLGTVVVGLFNVFSLQRKKTSELHWKELPSRRRKRCLKTSRS